MQETKTVSRYREALHDRILDTALKLFSTYGIKAVKMDDIARQLNISKRTLYEVYENKETLLFEVVKRYRATKEQESQQLLLECRNVMDIMLKMYYVKVDEFKQISSLFYSDLVKYPRVVELLQEDRQGQRQRAMKFMQRGVEEGYFRCDIDLPLVLKLFESVAQFIMSGQIYKDYSIEEIFRSIVFVSFRGICTRKGVDVLDTFLASNKQ